MKEMRYLKEMDELEYHRRHGFKISEETISLLIQLLRDAEGKLISGDDTALENVSDTSTEVTAEILENPGRFLKAVEKDEKLYVKVSNRLINAMKSAAYAVRELAKYVKLGLTPELAESMKLRNDKLSQQLEEYHSLNMTPVNIQAMKSFCDEQKRIIERFKEAEKLTEEGEELIVKSQAVKMLQEYAEQKFAGGEVELANGILKAKCFLNNGSVPSVVKQEPPVQENGKEMSDLVKKMRTDVAFFGHEPSEEKAKVWNLFDTTTRLMECFENSFINHNNEFIAHRKANEYFSLDNCDSELDVKCKVLEYLSRAAYKTEPFSSDRKNREFNKFMLDGINEFLGTNFTEEDMNQIYTYLGNGCNHSKTILFVKRGYDMGLLKM